MGMFITDAGNRSELQEKIAAELREKMARNSEGEGGSKITDEELPDHVEDSEYVKSFKKSKPIPRVVIILIVLAVIFVACTLAITLLS